VRVINVKAQKGTLFFVTKAHKHCCFFGMFGDNLKKSCEKASLVDEKSLLVSKNKTYSSPTHFFKLKNFGSVTSKI